MRMFHRFKTIIQNLFIAIQYRIENIWLHRKYPDYEDNEYNCGSLKFIWGIKSWDDLSGSDANMWTMNDIEIDFDRDTSEYVLGVETVYQFRNGKISEVEYLTRLLSAFTEYMTDNNYNMDEPFNFWSCQSVNLWRAKDIPTLYTQFRLFVGGYKVLYGGDK